MRKLNNQTKDEMVTYLIHLIERGIYCYGNDSKLLANYLISCGCRIHMGPIRKKKLDKILKEKI